MSAKERINKLTDLTTEMQVELEKLRLPENCKTDKQEFAVDCCQADVTTIQEKSLPELREAFDG